MTAFVLDCSVAVTWCFEDEATPEGDALLNRLAGETAAVPTVWPLEVGNVLAMAERRGRIDSTKIAEFLALIEDLSIVVDDETQQRALREILALARTEGLTTYDAAYLDLAMRIGVPLATKDVPLHRAAERLGASLLPV